MAKKIERRKTRAARRHPQQKPQPAVNDSVPDFLNFFEQDGKKFCRQPDLSNTYNPDGLSLKAIDCELDYAFEPQDFHPDSRLLEQTNRESGDDAATYIRLHSVPGDSIVEKSASFPTPEHLIQADDARLADLIRASPLALLQSFVAQDALARWTYAVRYSHDADTRGKAKGYRDVALPAKRGNPGKSDPDLRQLLHAYDDLRQYCTRIFDACKNAKTVKDLERMFPDAERLERHFATQDIPTYNLTDILDSKKTKPAPSAVAVSYISAYSGLSRSRIMDLITKARKPSA